MRMLYDLAKQRKTVRKFREEKPSIEKLMYCLKMANEAPSGMNAQPWRFLVVEDEEMKRQIRETCEKAEKDFYENVRGKLKEWLNENSFNWKKPFLEEAPYLLLVFSKKTHPIRENLSGSRSDIFSSHWKNRDLEPSRTHRRIQMK